jgi:hypothetical protein
MAFASISVQLFKQLKISVLNRFWYKIRFRRHLKSHEKIVRYQFQLKKVQVFFPTKQSKTTKIRRRRKINQKRKTLEEK